MIQLSSERAEELASRLYELLESDRSIPDRLLGCRQILELLYKSLTENVKISFNGLFARIQYVNESMQMPAELYTQANLLRILANKVAHEERIVTSARDLHAAILAIYGHLQFFCTGFADKHLEDYLRQTNAIPFAQPQDSKKDSFICCLNSWKLQPDDVHPTALEITAITETGHKCSILLRDDNSQAGHEGRLYTRMARSLWKYASLYCHNLSQVAGKDYFFISNPHSLIVLEPDFLVDASGLAECFSSTPANPLSFIFSRFFSEPSSEAMLQGQIINGIFDELFFYPDVEYLELFKSSLAQQPIAMVALGKDSAMQIYKRIETDHLPHLKEFCAQNSQGELMLEPSFICPDYGLQGRLDLLIGQDDKYRIVELKSGKPPQTDIWQNHQLQAIAYNMIIRRAYGDGHMGNTAIFYSAADKNPVRHVVTVSLLEQDLMMCRNRIIGILNLLESEPDRFFSWLLLQGEIPKNRILSAKLKQMQNLLEGLEAYEYEWFLAQVQRIVREVWFVKTGDNQSGREGSYGFNSLWQESISEKRTAYKIITGLQPRGYNSKLIDFNCSDAGEIADFREGDIVTLYNQDIPVTNQEILRGVLCNLSSEALSITVRGGLKNHHRFSSDTRWAIEHDTLETSLYAPLASLTQFLSSSPSARRRIIGIQPPETPVQAKDDPSIEAVKDRMLAVKDLFIVQGPPGTGKTSGLLGKYIRDIYAQGNKKVLIISFTNRAVDEICLCLQREQVPYIRSGSSAVIQDQLMQNLMQGKRFEEMAEIISANRIWVGTVQSANAWYQDLLRIIKIDELIIDEASQIIESSILGIISRIPKTILIGDQHQLPPISVQSPMPYEFTSSELQALDYGNYHQSLMERLHKVLSNNGSQANLAMLKHHYRMHEDIAGLIGPVYNNQLSCVLTRQIEPLISEPGLPALFNTRLLWIECLPSQVQNYDPRQVELVLAILQCLQTVCEPGKMEQKAGIIAPFRAMIHAIRRELPEAQKSITIDTVERFQGSERDNIILCLPLRSASNLKNVQSLSDDGRVDRKLNVAISRARERLIIIGNEDICRRSGHYSALLDSPQIRGLKIAYQAALDDLKA